MTLPFRRRHHDDESAHDRARALTSREMLESVTGEDAGWLARHLDGCAECRRDREAYPADRQLLRALRERTPEPPRDLWARTSAALDREARSRRGRSAGSRGRRPTLPFGAMAGALIVLVVVGVSLVPPLTPPSPSSGSPVAVVTPVPVPTEIDVTAGRVGWLRPAANGSWELVIAEVDTVCPRTRPSCRSLLENDPARPVALAGTPSGVTISPTEDQLVVEARGVGSAPDRIYVVDVPPPSPAVSPEPAGTATPGAQSVAAATPEPATAEPATPEPATPEPVSPAPTSAPEGLVEIATGVVVVGEAAYSVDGHWLAFSARPSDGSTGPDLYLWSAGQPTAIPVTNDHRTFFSSWLGGQVLASRVEPLVAPGASDGPAAEASPEATSGEAGGQSAAPSLPAQVEAHAVSFLLDPSTLARTEISRPDVWLPVVDPTGRFVVYWSGTLLATAGGLDWQVGTGQLVLDGWSPGPDLDAVADPSAPPSEPDASAAPALGPVGAPMPVVTTPTIAFAAKFDPTGTRLAVWVGEQVDAEVGRIYLLLLDPTTGAIVTDKAPLPGVPALRRFSIEQGRLAWVSPSGQDGQESAVQVLGWSLDQFGEIRTIPARDLYIVR